MTDPIQRIKEEMDKRGLMRKLAVCVNGNPPPADLSQADVVAFYKTTAQNALMGYAAQHEDFAEMLAEAAFEHLMADLLTDDLFTPDPSFTPTLEEAALIRKAKNAAALLNILRPVLGL